MSIYRGSRPNRFVDGDLAWENVLQKASAPQGTLPRSDSPNAVPTPEELARLRRAEPASSLLPATILWLKCLPRDARPMALATQHARIVNLLAQLWADREACNGYFAELLRDGRGNRMGFPTEVREEIHVLHEFFLSFGAPGLRHE